MQTSCRTFRLLRSFLGRLPKLHFSFNQPKQFFQADASVQHSHQLVGVEANCFATFLQALDGRVHGDFMGLVQASEKEIEDVGSLLHGGHAA
jgi:hypothetical protein